MSDAEEGQGANKRRRLSPGGGDEGSNNGDNGGGEEAPFFYTGDEEIWPRDLTRIVVDPSVESINFYAFYDLKQLVEVKLPEGLKCIGQHAFSGCSSLRDISIPASVKVIEYETFQNCKQLVGVDLSLCEGLENIDDRAFRGCTSLRTIKIPATVRMIGERAFEKCQQLDEVELLEGLERISPYAFKECKSLKQFKIPSTVKVVEREAFNGCKQLLSVDLCEGLERIENSAFCGCASIQNIRIPSTVKVIDKVAFGYCEKLSAVDFSEGLQRIEVWAFESCTALTRVKIPSTVVSIDSSSFQYCHQLMSIEFCDGPDMRGLIPFFDKCSSLRNLWVPRNACVYELSWFSECHDLMMLFGSFEEIEEALQSRFVELPAHELCYFKSQHQTEVVIERLNGILLREENKGYDADCLGMTPLHILACSTKHDIGLYQVIIKHQPGSIITEDRWSCTPILYAIWGAAPQEVLQLLIDAQKSAFPDFVLKWDMMVETLCRAGASPHTVKRLLDIQQSAFPGQSVDWQKVATELTINCLAKCNGMGYSSEEVFPNWRYHTEVFTSARAYHEIHHTLTEVFPSTGHYRELANGLLEMQQKLFPDQNGTDWRSLCEEFTQPLKGWSSTSYPHKVSKGTFIFLMKCNIPARVGAIGVRKWRLALRSSLECLSSGDCKHYTRILSHLATNEREYVLLKDTTFLLELALWRWKADEAGMLHQNNAGVGNDEDVHRRRLCRLNCGADIIIPNVLPYLTPALGGIDIDSSSESDAYEGSDVDPSANSSGSDADDNAN